MIFSTYIFDDIYASQLKFEKKIVLNKKCINDRKKEWKRAV